MTERSKTETKSLSSAEFLAALELSGILTDAKCREVQSRFARRAGSVESPALARQLIYEGTLTEFQARRLLRGKKRLDFGRYVLVDHIGQGGRGRVFKARHRLMDRIVALKVILPDSAMSESVVSRFFREIKIVGLMEHANVVRAIDADVHEGSPYIVMEYLEGDDLEQFLARRGPLPPDQVIDFSAQAARGLAHAHEKGVIHRDVKPTNLFLTKTGIVKILDLGCGELVGMKGQTGNVFDTDEGVVVGTTDFMSPEQVKDKPIDVRTDQFSLGCTMYRLLTGAYAFPGLTREERLVKRIRERHLPIAEVRPGLPPGLVGIVDRLLALRPEDRFGTATETAEALEALNRPAARPERTTSSKPESKTSVNDASSVSEEPEEALDWSMIESALRPKGQRPGEASRLVERNGPKPRATKGISSHRKVLEADGIETGRDVHAKYRQELIQMNRTMTELRQTEANEEPPPLVETWLERMGEKLGEFLSEPSAGQIIICVLLVLLALTLGFIFTAG